MQHTMSLINTQTREQENLHNNKHCNVEFNFETRMQNANDEHLFAGCVFFLFDLVTLLVHLVEV